MSATAELTTALDAAAKMLRVCAAYIDQPVTKGAAEHAADRCEAAIAAWNRRAPSVPVSEGMVAGTAWPDGFFILSGDARLRECATEDCYQHVSIRIERGGVGSDHCEPCARRIAAALVPSPLPAQPAPAVVCDVLTMQHSSGFPDYFTRVAVGGRSLTLYRSKIKGRCEYHAAEFNWLLNGGEKPHILDFDDTEPEGLAEYQKSIAQPASAVGDTHAFKNFHRLLCERFGYTHDEKDWRRDQVSLIEWIAKRCAPAVVDEAMVWRLITMGWNACRKSLYAVCEDVGEEADRIRTTGAVGTAAEEQHSKGYHAGQHRAAKSIARGFNSMEAIDDDNVREAIRAALSEPKTAGGEQPTSPAEKGEKPHG